MNYSASKTIRSLAEDDRPREKGLRKGIQHLSNSELIAVLLGSGGRNKNALELAQELLSKSNNSLEKLSQQKITELIRFKGIGITKAMVIKAGFELSRRSLLEDAAKIIKIQSSQEAFKLIIAKLHRLKTEEFWVAFMDRSNHVIALEQLSKGGIHGTVVDIRLILKAALDHLACGLILFHNHPSGNLKPSQHDDRITNQLLDAAKLVDILILDHLIISDHGYYSYADDAKLR